MQVRSSPRAGADPLAERDEQLALDADVEERAEGEGADPDPDGAVALGVGRLRGDQVGVGRGDGRVVGRVGRQAGVADGLRGSRRAVGGGARNGRLGQGLAAQLDDPRGTPDPVRRHGPEPAVDGDGHLGEGPPVALRGLEGPPRDDDADHAALGRVAARVDVALRPGREDRHATEGFLDRPAGDAREVGRVEVVVRARASSGGSRS